MYILGRPYTVVLYVQLLYFLSGLINIIMLVSHLVHQNDPYGYIYTLAAHE